VIKFREIVTNENEIDAGCSYVLVSCCELGMLTCSFQ